MKDPERDKIPREIVAQALDYASGVEKLKPDKNARIYDGLRNGQSLAADFEFRFKAKLDDATERILGYLLTDRDWWFRESCERLNQTLRDWMSKCWRILV